MKAARNKNVPREETKIRHQHGIDRHQHDAADDELRMDRLRLFLLLFTLERFEESGASFLASEDGA